jgi:VanZ family protein
MKLPWSQIGCRLHFFPNSDRITHLWKENKIKRVLVRIPAIAITVFSFFLSSQAILPRLLPNFWASDKILHLVYFAMMAVSWTLWFSLEDWKAHPVRNSIICIAVVSVFGILDEYHQSFVPGRHASELDWLADTTGAALGNGCGFVLRRFGHKVG